jgi:hypothetical protein
MNAIEVARTIDVDYVARTPTAAPRLEIDSRAVVVPKETQQITWRLHGVPADVSVSLDVDPVPVGWTRSMGGCHDVTMFGPAVGESWLLHYRVSASTVEGAALLSDVRVIASVTTDNCINVKVTYNADGTWTVDPLNVVVYNNHDPVQWSFFGVTPVSITFKDPSGASSSPFQSFDSTTWRATGASATTGDFKYTITGRVGGTQVTDDPGICNLGPPPPIHHGKDRDARDLHARDAEDAAAAAGAASTAALRPPAASAAPAAPGRP